MKRYIQNEGGATAMEYALIAAGISVAIVAVVLLLGGDINDLFVTVSNALSPSS